MGLFGCAYASLGNFHAPFQSTNRAFERLNEMFPQNYTVLGAVLNMLGVLMAVNGDFISTNTNLERALNIFYKTSGNADFPYNYTFVVDIVHSRSINFPCLQRVFGDLKQLFPKNYPFPNQLDCQISTG